MRREYHIRARGQDFIFGRRTWIMGVLNITPDSFSDGGLYFDADQAIKQGQRLVDEGADILDIGGESTRPGSDAVPAEEEKRRILPVITEIRKSMDVLISVDTTKAEVAEAALEAGADIINDISAGRFDERILSLAAERITPLILMHMLGTPKIMQADPHYEDLLPEINAFFEARIAKAVGHGVNRRNLILDPGIGFGKRHQDNLCLLKHLGYLGGLGHPLLVGVSRKSFLGRILDDAPAEERLEGTIAAALISMLHGAHILRVHDVAAIKKAVTVAEEIMYNMECCGSAESGGTDRVYDAE